MASDEDTRAAGPLADSQEVQQLATEFSSRSAWLAPEVLALPAGTVARFLAAEPGLAPYRFFLEDLERQRPHTLSSGEEKLLALSGMIAQAPGTMSGILRNADLPYPEVTLSSGEKVAIDQAGYGRYRALPDRADRILVFREFWKLFGSYQRTLGVALDAQVKRDLFYARARNYPTCLASSLAANNVPEAVYRTLIAEANRALPTLHRAFKLRGRLLGIDDLAYHDIYPPLVADLDASYPIGKGEALVLSALAPLGAEYVATVRRGFESRWMDVYPRPGKRSGAYSNGSAYDVHPYVLMNYNDDYESVSTLAHEWGHAMHSHLANAAQPYPTADYSIFIAEVASTFNEALLLRRSLDEAKSDGERISLLGSYVENLRGTFFRQTMFAEFELATHEAAERGEALTGEKLSAHVRRAAAPLPRPRPGRHAHRRRLHRRVGVHPALLLQLLRLPVRHLAGRLDAARPRRARRRHHGARSLPGAAEVRRLALPVRAAQGGRRRPRDARSRTAPSRPR